MPKVFIGIPTFNRPQYVAETIRSVLAQTFEDWIAVVSDNVSAPENVAAVQRTVAEIGDPRLSFYQQEENGGEYGQGRFFFRAAAGCEYFVILHDDDLLRPGYLAAAVEALDRDAGLSVFVANCTAIDGAGADRAEFTEWYLQQHGRKEMRAGPFSLLEDGFVRGCVPICGTVFRRADLVRTGFVDPEGRGNYPFELDVILRTCDLRLRGWFDDRPLLTFRFHDAALRKQDRLLENATIINSMIRLLAKRRFEGRAERYRRTLLSRLYRALAEVAISERRHATARHAILQALRTGGLSVRTWLSVPVVLLCPALLRRPASPAKGIVPKALES